MPSMFETEPPRLTRPQLVSVALGILASGILSAAGADLWVVIKHLIALCG